MSRPLTPHGVDDAADVRRKGSRLWVVVGGFALLVVVSLAGWRVLTLDRSWAEAVALLDVVIGADGAIATVAALLLAYREIWRTSTPNALAFETPAGATIALTMARVTELEGKNAPVALTPRWRLRNHGPGPAEIRSLEAQVQVINDYDIDESWSFFSFRIEPEVRSAMAGNVGSMWEQIGDADLAYWRTGGWTIEEGDAVELRRFMLFVKTAAEVGGLARNANPTVRIRLVVHTARGGDMRRLRFPLVIESAPAAATLTP